MELIGGFVNPNLEELRLDLESGEVFIKNTATLAYDEAGNAFARIVRFSTKEGIAAELVEDVNSEPLVNLSISGGESHAPMLLARNFRLADKEFFWDFYEGLPQVKAQRSARMRRMN